MSNEREVLRFVASRAVYDAVHNRNRGILDVNSARSFKFHLTRVITRLFFSPRRYPRDTMYTWEVNACVGAARVIAH